MHHPFSSLAVLDHVGIIVSTNSAWEECEHNVFTGRHVGLGNNYLVFCEQMQGVHAQSGRTLAEHIRDLLSMKRDHFIMHYNCPVPRRANWFHVRGTCTILPGSIGAVISHRRVTRRTDNRVVLGSPSTQTRLDNLSRLTNDVESLHDQVRNMAVTTKDFLATTTSAMRGQVDRLQGLLIRVKQSPCSLGDEAKRDLSAALDSAEQLEPLLGGLDDLAKNLQIS